MIIRINVKCDFYECKKQAVINFKLCPDHLSDAIDNVFDE